MSEYSIRKPIPFLDFGPLGLITHLRQTEEAEAITSWLSHMLKPGRRVLVPAIVYYELKRELLRADKPFSVDRLDQFTKASNRYIPLTDEALALVSRTLGNGSTAGATYGGFQGTGHWSRRSCNDERKALFPVHYRQALERDSSLG